MLFRLFLLFTLVPIVELALLLRLGGWLGLAPTVALVLATGAAGAWMARREGLRTWRAAQAELSQGRFPGSELLHSLLILVAGVVLVTPGVLTDLAGILLLVPPVRSGLIRALRRRFEAGLLTGAVRVSSGVWPFGGSSDDGGGPPGRGEEENHVASGRAAAGEPEVWRRRAPDRGKEGDEPPSDEQRRPPRVVDL